MATADSCKNPTSADAGSTIAGSTTASNELLGGLGNDKITGGSVTDTIATGGGSDAINLGATHISDHVALYQGAGLALGLLVVLFSGIPRTTLSTVEISPSQAFGACTQPVQLHSSPFRSQALAFRPFPFLGAQTPIFRRWQTSRLDWPHT